MAKFYDGPENPVCKLEGNLSSVEMRLIWYAGKDVMIPFLLPCRTAKDEYIEQEPSDYVFKCMDGDIHIPEYGLLKTDFYYKEWMSYTLKVPKFVNGAGGILFDPVKILLMRKYLLYRYKTPGHHYVVFKTPSLHESNSEFGAKDVNLKMLLGPYNI